MSVVDDLLKQLDAGTRKAAREVVTGRPSQARCDGGGANGSTPEALEAPGTVGAGSDAVKCPVLFTQVARCDDCPWTCCEVDGTCWKAERDEIARLKAAGEYETAKAAHVAPWSKRAIRDAEAAAIAALSEQERRRQAKEDEIKAERKAARERKKGTEPIPGTKGKPVTVLPGSKKFDTPKPTPTETLAAAVAPGRGSRGGKLGQPEKISPEQFDAAYAELDTKSARAVAFERWEAWGCKSPTAGYQAFLSKIRRSGRGMPDGRRFGDGPRAREEKRTKEAA